MTFESTLVSLLDRGLAARFRARGDSMHPTIRCGEHVRVFPLQHATPVLGDVVLARQPRGLTAHRVVRIVRHNGRIVGVATRGDNALASDPIIALGSLLGRVEQIERNGVPTAVARSAPSRLHVVARRLAHIIDSLRRKF